MPRVPCAVPRDQPARQGPAGGCAGTGAGVRLDPIRTATSWFFEKGLPGYSWYVPKQNGYVNLGIGAIAVRLKRRGEHVDLHWDRFVAALRRRGLIDDTLKLVPGGYSYYLRGNVDTYRIGNAFLVGDAAGLATRDMAEGIGPAVRSGILAAKAIADGVDYRLDPVSAHSLPSGLTRRALEYLLLRGDTASAA